MHRIHFIIVVLLGSFSIKAQDKMDSLFNLLGDNPSEVLSKATSELMKAEVKHDAKKVYDLKFVKANALNQLGFFDESLALYFKLLKEAEQNKNYTAKAKLCYEIGLASFQMADYSNVVKFQKMYRETLLKTNDKIDTFLANSEIGLGLVALGKVNEGITLQRKNLQNAMSKYRAEEIVLMLDNLSNSFHEINELDSSLYYQKIILTVDSKKNLNHTASLNQHLAEIYISKGDFQNASKYVDIAINAAQDLKSNDWLYDAYKNKSDILNHFGKHKEALEYYKKYQAIKDSVYQKDYDTKMASIHGVYDLEKKQYAINDLEKKTVIQNQKLRIWSALFFLSLLGALALYFYLKKKKSDDENKIKDKFANQIIDAQETERERIAKDLHDSVGQNLLYLKNKLSQSDFNQDAKITNSLTSAIDEIRTISKNLYPNHLEKYGLEESVAQLGHQMMETTNVFISSDLDGIDQHLDKNQKINVYRIIQEFLNNATKYSQATAIRIASESNNTKVDLILQDNGIGFDKEVVVKNMHLSSGLLNMEERAKMIKGQFSLESKVGEGTKVVVSLPF